MTDHPDSHPDRHPDSHPDETIGFFRPGEGDALMPAELARSLWSADQMHGVAVGAALGRAAERELHDRGRDDLRPVRVTVDLFRPARMRECRLRAEVVRESARLCLVDTVLEQDGDERDGGRPIAVARASVLALKPTEDPTGEVWMPESAPEPPPLDVVPVSEEPRVPFFWSEGVGWSQDFAQHQNGGRKQLWQTIPAAVAGETPSTFVAAAAVADSASMVTNWGSRGVEFINTDINLTLARLPVSREIGLAATDRVLADGLAVGTVVLFDREGRIGSCTVTAMSNARRAVDFEGTRFTREGPRHSSPGA